MKLLWVILSLLIVSPHVFAELTDKDIQRIQEVIQAENKKIHADMVAMELKLTQKIQESENRLRSELNSQLNARMGDFTIVFGITSGGFFLLFASILLINTLKGKSITDRKAILLFSLSIGTALLCFISTAHTQRVKAGTMGFFTDLVCDNLTVTGTAGFSGELSANKIRLIKVSTKPPYRIGPSITLETNLEEASIIMEHSQGGIISANVNKEEHAKIMLLNKQGNRNVSLIARPKTSTVAILKQKHGENNGILLSSTDIPEAPFTIIAKEGIDKTNIVYPGPHHKLE